MLRQIRSQERFYPRHTEANDRFFVGEVKSITVNGEEFATAAIRLNNFMGEAVDILSLVVPHLPTRTELECLDPGIDVKELVVVLDDLIITQKLNIRNGFLHSPAGDHRRLTWQFRDTFEIDTRKPTKDQTFEWKTSDSNLAFLMVDKKVVIKFEILTELNLETGELKSSAKVYAVEVVHVGDHSSVGLNHIEALNKYFNIARIGANLRAYLNIKTYQDISSEDPIDARYSGEDYLESTKGDGMFDVEGKVTEQPARPSRRLIPALTPENGHHFLNHPKMPPLAHHLDQRKAIVSAPLKLTADCDVIALHLTGEMIHNRVIDQRSALDPDIFISEIAFTSGKDAFRYRLHDERPFVGFPKTPGTRDVTTEFKFYFDDNTRCADGSKPEELDLLLKTRGFSGRLYAIIDIDTGRLQASLKIRKDSVYVKDHNHNQLDPSQFLDFLRKADFGIVLNARMC